MCKVFLFIVIAGIYCDHAFGQDAREQVDTVVAAGNRNASFPGGADSMMNYFSLNLRYPSKAMEQKLEGEVMVGFEIDELGMIHNALVLSGLDGPPAAVQIAFLIATAVSAALNFVGMKFFVFKPLSLPEVE